MTDESSAIYVVDEIVTKPGEGRACYTAYMERYVPGAQARGMEQALSEKPAELARSFARLAAEKASARAAEQRRAGKKPPKPKPENSITDYARFDAAGANGILVTIRAKDAPARQGVTAILYGRENDRLVVALAVSDTADAAKHDAEAAWRSR